MKISLAQRCAYHRTREAVARCPECARFFCRECISEHEDRVLCANCLSTALRVEKPKHSRIGPVLRVSAALTGLLVAWWFYDLLGRGLTALPADVHAGTIWEDVE